MVTAASQKSAPVNTHYSTFVVRFLNYIIRLGPICPIGPFGWNETVDQLSAAQTGALVANLMHEVKGDAPS